ncbi:MAG: hypothetical protein GC179_10760 [Anaerolineaceae bacterium]|nr:hypothetical protein [Anaerolineaceae bacterium]
MITSLHELINIIESVNFDANMSVFSGFNSFHRALVGNQTIQELREVLTDFPNAAEELYDHFISLIQQDTQSQYEHPHDIAISSYLFALSTSSNNGMALEAAKEITLIPNLIWAKRLAEIILANQTATAETEVKVPEASKYSFTKSNYFVIVGGLQISINSRVSESSTTLTKTTNLYKLNPRSKSIRLIMSA